MTSIDPGRFLALCGIKQWAEGVIEQAGKLDVFAREVDMTDVMDRKLRFNRERHYFLIAAHQLVEHVRWAEEKSFFSNRACLEVLALQKDICDMRDLNEHAIEYFKGAGQHPNRWTALKNSDPSATIGTKIGGRLDWQEVSRAAERLLRELPAFGDFG